MTLAVSAARVAAFPGERLVFEATAPGGRAAAEIRWSGGDDPPTGSGARFDTLLRVGGTRTITATCGDEVESVEVMIPPVEDWLARAATFFGPSVDLTPVRVVASRAVAGAAGSAWTCHAVIRFKRPTTRSDLPDESTLIHELGHVWEAQHGEAQLLGGIVEQLQRRLGRDPYDYGGPAGLRATRRLEDLRKEGQARAIQELWNAQHGGTTDERGVPFATPGYLDDLRRLVGGAGIGQRSAVRRTLVGAIDGAFAAVLNRVLVGPRMP